MRLRARLLVLGAALPALGALAVVVAGGVLFDRALLDALDESLRRQAAVETVSMFDTEHAPHLHLPGSPMLAGLAHSTGTRAIHDARGARVVAASAGVPLPDAVLPEPLDATPRLSTLALGEGRRARALTVTVPDPRDGRRYTLWLAESLDDIERTRSIHVRTVGLMAVLLALALLGLQAVHAAWLARRVENLTGHMQRLHEGALDHRPRPDRAGDELGELTRAVAAATEKLEAARRSEERLLADAAHELRTPLAAMRAQVDVTLRRPREAGALRLALEEVRAEVDRLAGLADRLLERAVADGARWALAPVDLVPTLERAVEAHRAEAGERRIRLGLNAPASMPAVASGEAIRAALENLLANALRHAPEGSEVAVRAVRAGDRWRIAVADEGPGVPASEREAVFRPFHRLDRRLPGAGLGLALVRETAERHRGRAYFEDVARGATAVLELPAAPGP